MNKGHCDLILVHLIMVGPNVRGVLANIRRYWTKIDNPLYCYSKRTFPLCFDPSKFTKANMKEEMQVG